jgi:hypothetical protein
LEFVNNDLFNLYDSEKFENSLLILKRLSSSPTYSLNVSRYISHGFQYNDGLLLEEYIYNPIITGGDRSLSYSINKKLYPSSLFYERNIFIKSINIFDINETLQLTKVLDEKTLQSAPSITRKPYETEEEYNNRVELARRSLYLNYYGSNPGILFTKVLQDNLYNLSSSKKVEESIKNIGYITEDVYSAMLNDSVYSSFDNNEGLARKTNIPKSVVIEENDFYNLADGQIMNKDESSNDKDKNSLKSSVIAQQSNKAITLINSINLNLQQTLSEQKCKIFPHYFNDMAWRNDFNNNLNAGLCDGKPETFPEETLKIIVKLISNYFHQ